MAVACGRLSPHVAGLATLVIAMVLVISWTMASNDTVFCLCVACAHYVLQVASWDADAPIYANNNVR